MAGAAAISPPYDLAASAPHIAQALGGLYVRNFLSTMIPKALAKEKQYPGCLDRNAARKARNFEQYDTAVTAPLHGFEDCWDYYGQSSCGRYLAAIRKPTMFISSEDDPFYPASTLPSSEILSSPFIYPQFTPKGGHAGFVYGDWRAPRVWAEEQIVDFFQACEVLR
ncbi:hypothetical protein HY256_00015 [Candidatus Sumerlaeota bacterium]|nr:hypothetical protein [Candidatus Sumerlaeota bacterium]